MSNNFRDLIPDPDYRMVKGIETRDACSHADMGMQIPLIRDFVDGWEEKVRKPFVGITTDGQVKHGLYALAAENAPVAAMVAAAGRLMQTLSGDEAAKVRFPIDAEAWRRWSNPEFYVNRLGLRLEEVAQPVRDAVLEVVQASLSDKGFKKARDCMRMNHFLGELVNGRKVMNQYSYNFLLFGEPSLTEPWGWNLYGHHLVLNCFVLGGQMVISPTFMGAEPNIIDTGPWAGTTLFMDEERDGLALMLSLTREQQDRAQVYKQMKDPAMPPGRWILQDQRHLGGAFQDNRIIPYEGVPVTEMTAAQQQLLLRTVEHFIEYLPPGSLAARMTAVERHLGDTHFCWIGSYGDDDPFYYRIQSPVVMVEFDHHSGVFLTNQEPAKCHTHTIVRTPNGNDYGKDLLRLHYEQVHPGRAPGQPA